MPKAVLWAPWRMEYIRAARAGAVTCIFCPLLEAGDDRERLVLYRGAHSFVVLNRYPYNPGHLMVVPNTHGEAMQTIARAVWGEVMWLSGCAVEIFQREMQAEGANCGLNIGRVGGAGVTDHVHFHVVPRWRGDTNFFPVIGETKAMPEYLLETYDRLHPHFARLGG